MTDVADDLGSVSTDRPNETTVAPSPINQPTIYRRRAIIRALRQLSPISRVELASSTGISKAAVTRLTVDLIQEGLVLERGVQSSSKLGGKPRVLLGLNPAALGAIGCVMQPGIVSAALSGFDGTIESRAVIHFDREEDPDAVIGYMLQAIREVLEHNPPQRHLEAIGIGVPGMVDDRGRVFMASMPGWTGVPLRDLIEESFGTPVRVDNNARLNTLAEVWFGGAPRSDSTVVLDLSDGIAAGVVIRGRLWRGAHSLAGEVGHTNSGEPERLCRCGGTSCWELSSSTAEFLRVLSKHGIQGKQGESLTIAEVVGRLQDHDPVLEEIIGKHAEGLAVGISNIVLTYDPELIVLRGGSFGLGPNFVSSVNKLVQDRFSKFGGVRPQIVASDLGASSDVLGAVSLVLYDAWGLDPL